MADALWTAKGKHLNANEPVRVVLHGGVGVRIDGQDLFGPGEFTVPYGNALELVHSGRAHFPPVREPESAAPAPAAPEVREPEPETRDPAPKTRSRRKR